MAASASGHLAGQVAAVSQLLPVRAQRPSARQSPARRPAGGDCRMTRFTPPKPDKSLDKYVDRDRGTPRGAAPPTPPGIRVTYHGGSIELSCSRNMEAGETEGIEVVVAQGGL